MFPSARRRSPHFGRGKVRDPTDGVVVVPAGRLSSNPCSGNCHRPTCEKNTVTLRSGGMSQAQDGGRWLQCPGLVSTERMGPLDNVSPNCRAGAKAVRTITLVFIGWDLLSQASHQTWELFALGANGGCTPSSTTQIPLIACNSGPFAKRASASLAHYFRFRRNFYTNSSRTESPMPDGFDGNDRPPSAARRLWQHGFWRDAIL
jgi:hypothetical protein